jgi:hypothetical protein
MDFSSINWLAVVICVVVSMISGTLWYNPKTFFPVWWKGIGKTGEPGMGGGDSSMGLTWGLVVLGSIVQVIFFAVFLNALGANTLASGVSTGFWLWLGFIAPTYLVNKLFADQFPKVWAIEVGNHLLNFLIFGAILGSLS